MKKEVKRIALMQRLGYVDPKLKLEYKLLVFVDGLAERYKLNVVRCSPVHSSDELASLPISGLRIDNGFSTTSKF